MFEAARHLPVILVNPGATFRGVARGVREGHFGWQVSIYQRYNQLVRRVEVCATVFGLFPLIGK